SEVNVPRFANRPVANQPAGAAVPPELVFVNVIWYETVPGLAKAAQARVTKLHVPPGTSITCEIPRLNGYTVVIPVACFTPAVSWGAPPLGFGVTVSGLSPYAAVVARVLVGSPAAVAPGGSALVSVQGVGFPPTQIHVPVTLTKLMAVKPAASRSLSW